MVGSYRKVAFSSDQRKPLTGRAAHSVDLDAQEVVTSLLLEVCKYISIKPAKEQTPALVVGADSIAQRVLEI